MVNKRGVEMTANTIIILILVLIILIAMVFFLTGGFKNFNKGTECLADRGSCRDKCNANEYVVGWRCPNSDQVCCATNVIGG